MTADRDGSEQVLRPLYATSAAAGLIVAPMPRGPLQSVDAGTAFGGVGTDHVRVSYANSRENLSEALARIRRFVAGSGRG